MSVTSVRYILIVLTFFLLDISYSYSLDCVTSTQAWEKFGKIGALYGSERIKGYIDLVSELKKCNSPVDSTYSNAIFLLGFSYGEAERFEDAIKLINEAININLKKTGSVRHFDLIKNYSYLGLYKFNSGRYNDAIYSYRQAIKIGQDYPSKWSYLSDCYKRLAYVYLQLGDFERALESCNSGMDYAKKVGDSLAVTRNLFEAARIDFRMGNFKTAETSIRNCIFLGTLCNESVSNLGIYHQTLGDVLATQQKIGVEQTLKHAASLFNSVKDSSNLSSCFNTWGFYLLKVKKNYASALRLFQSALDFTEYPEDRGLIYSNIGQVYLELKLYDKSLSNHQEALERFSVDFESSDYIQNPRFVEIKSFTQKDYLRETIQDKADTWLAYAKHTNNDKLKLQNALKTYMLADTMIDYMRWEHTGSVSKLFWREKTRGMYERAIETCYLLNDPAKAFYFFEKSRAVMLNDQLNELGANQLLSAKDQEKERILKQKVSSLQDKLAAAESDEKAAGEIRTKLFTAQEEQESFIKQLEKSSTQYYAYKYDNQVPDIAELRSKVLHDNQTFVSYFVGDSALYGLAISRKTISFKKSKLPDYTTYNTQFQKLIGNRDLQNRQFGDYLKVSYSLYDILLKPFAIAPDSRVIVSPDGSFLPFEALSSSPTAPEYLVKKYAFSYTYSAGYLSKSKRSETERFSTKSFLGLSPVEFAPKLSQATLPGSDVALKIINDHFLFSKTLTGSEASRNAFVKNSPDYKIVQLFTHATADSTGTIPTLYFADSTLKLNELTSGQKSNTQLLVLSACRTGVGKNQRGEGVFSLARGFAGMGIPSTLTTLWSVENDPIYALTKLFYAELDKELPLDIALQNAQNEWLKTASPGDKLPYAWAGMVLVGNAEPVDMGLSRAVGYALMGIIIVLIVFTANFFQSRRKMSLAKSM